MRESIHYWAHILVLCEETSPLCSSWYLRLCIRSQALGFCFCPELIGLRSQNGFTCPDVRSSLYVSADPVHDVHSVRFEDYRGVVRGSQIALGGIPFMIVSSKLMECHQLWPVLDFDPLTVSCVIYRTNRFANCYFTFHNLTTTSIQELQISIYKRHYNYPTVVTKSHNDV